MFSTLPLLPPGVIPVDPTVKVLEPRVQPKGTYKMHEAQKLVNHVALLLDSSSSMQDGGHVPHVIRTTDETIKHLMQRSEQMGQETRVSIYLFDNTARCILSDIDVMHLPSIGGLYKTGGMTAMIDCLVLAYQDFAKTPQTYGDHGFLIYCITDGQENQSNNKWPLLEHLTAKSPENYTVAFLVPNLDIKGQLVRQNVPAGSIMIWDATNKEGFKEVGKVVQASIDNYTQARSTGTRGSKSVFEMKMGESAVNAQTVRQALVPVDTKKYSIHDVVVPAGSDKIRVDEFCLNVLGHKHYQPGSCFYQFVKAERIQGNKNIIVWDKKAKVAYSGPEARKLVGLEWGGPEVKMKPGDNPDFDIFIQSNSNNRHLFPGTRLLFVKSPIL